VDLEPLLAQFHQAMLGIYDAARRLKPPYTAGDFRRMVLEMGGKGAADKLLAMGNPSEGFGTLLLRGKDALRLSVEYLVLQNPWRELFEPEQLAVARKRLRDVRCDPPPEDTAPSEQDHNEDAEVTVPDRVVYFNNCKNRPHERFFGPGAFYDLNVTGVQASQAVGLPVGQQCVVATTAPESRVTFTWYSFLRERRLRERENADRTRYRVFFGDPLFFETIAKDAAAAHPRYQAFFNVRGQFKQQSTISGSVPASQRPKGPPADTPEVLELRLELRDLQKPSKPKTPETLRRVQRILKCYERPSPITRYVKRTRGSTCQLCEEPGFLMRNGQLYCEAHHLFHLSKNPPPACLGPEYLVILCATCHRRMHYAKVGEPIRKGQAWRVCVDDDEVLFRV
jgi:5-methylcytosine-specific restriction endonuclease McrA